MKAANLLWSPEALSDIARIWDYYTRVAGMHTAEHVLFELEGACSVHEEHPFAGRARDDIRPALRSTVIDAHVIFYRVGRDAPEIFRILDERRDVEGSFGQ